MRVVLLSALCSLVTSRYHFWASERPGKMEGWPISLILTCMLHQRVLISNFWCLRVLKKYIRHVSDLLDPGMMWLKVPVLAYSNI